MEITVWESCLIKRVRKYNIILDSAKTFLDIYNEVNTDVLELSKITVEETVQEQEEGNVEQIPQPITFCIDWDLFKENKYEVYLLPKTNRSEEIRLRTKVSLTALRKGHIIKLIDISNRIHRIPLIIEIDNVTECFDGDIRIEGIHLNKLPSGE